MVQTSPKFSNQTVLYRTEFENSTKLSAEGVVLINSPAIASGGGLVLDGVNQYAYFKAPVHINRTGQTIEMCFTPQVPYTVAGFIGLYDGSSTSRYLCYKNNAAGSHTLVFFLGGSSSTTSFAATTYGPYWNVGQRLHLVITMATGAQTLYCNGVAVGTGTGTWTPGQPINTIIGATQGPANYLRGTIHKFAVYGETFSLAQITDLYERTTFRETRPESASLWLQLKETFSVDTDMMTQNVGLRNVKRVNKSNVGIGSLCRPTQLTPNGMSFDGADSLIMCDKDHIGAGDVTVGSLVKPDSLGEGSTGRIFSNGKFLVITNSTNNTLLVTSDNGSTNATAASNIFANPGRWITVIVTRSSATTGAANIYINGELSGTANQATGNPATGTTPLIIGNNSVRSTSFAGSIKTPFVFNQIMTPTQIRYLHSKMMRLLNV